jgi:hypothetical protein
MTGSTVAEKRRDGAGQQAEVDSKIDREVRESRKFTMEDAIARMAGSGAMKGASPVSPVEQAEMEIGSWLRSHLKDANGSLQIVLHRHLKGSEQLLTNVDQPLVALRTYCRRILASDHLLKELVREADVEWGRAMDERPYFESAGSAHPDDPYTSHSVRTALGELLRRLETL